MADNTTVETVIFEVDVSDYQNKLVGLTQNIDALKTQQKLLREETEKGGKGYLKAAEELEKVNAELKVSQDEYRNTQRTLVGFIGAQKNQVDTTNFANNSIKANRELLKQLQSQYINTKNPTQEFTKTIKTLSDELKKQEAAIGDTRRNVGNYGEGFKTAIGSIIDGVPALKGFQTAQLGVNAAMNANPIGAVVMLLTGLLEVFKNNAVVADQVSFAFQAVNKAVGSVIDTIVETVSSFDKLTAALANPVKFLFNLGKNAAVAAKEGYEAAKAMDELTVANARTAAAIKSNDRQVQALTKSLKDKTKSEQERISIANKIADLEIANSELNKKLAKDYLATEELRLKGRTKSAEDEAKIIELESNLRDAADEADIARAQRQTRINILLEKEKSENVKSENAKRRELRLEELKSIDELLNKEAELLDKKYETETQRELAAIVRREELIAQRIGTSEALIEAETLKRNLLLQNDELTATERLNIETEYQDNVLKIKQSGVDAQKKLDEQELESYIDLKTGVIMAAQSAANVLRGIGNLIGEQTAAGIAFQKVAAGIDLAINTAVSISNAIAGATSAAAATGPGAPFALIAYIGSMVGAVIGAIAQARTIISGVEAPTPPKFADGGEVFDVGGKPHSQGGTKYRGEDGNVIEVERGEKMFVMKATAAKQIHKLSQFNQMFGGRSWTGAPVNYAAQGGVVSDGGFSTSMVTEQVKADIQLKNAIREGFVNAPQPIVSVREIATVTKAVNKSVAVSEL